ncbi:DHHA1 domain-containing protein, partial [Trichocoleus sp. DQ-U1]|uniref:DHHA1 domain-containing protein n=1 Tax=Trichocoleus sp. DQ-U1 TaxID=2933926 RepID=UPI003299289A
VGSISEPQIVLDLLITDDSDIALEQAIHCEKVNQMCEVLCDKIEREAVAWVKESQINLEQELVLVIVKDNWHPGVFRIVARRLVERYSVPTFIGTYENENWIRGYGLGISGFHVFQALQSCQDLLGKFGGHKIAGGFSMPAENLKAFQKSLSKFAYNCL